MSTNRDPVSNRLFLSLDISNMIPLAELTVKVNSICEQAELQANPVVILRNSKNISDIKEWPGQVAIQDINRWERAVRKLERLPAVIIAAMSGIVSGSAFELFLVSDYRISTANLDLHIASNDQQVWPGMAIYRLANQIGAGRCRQLLMGKSTITAQRALDLGLIDEIADTINDNVIYSVVLRLRQLANKEMSIRRQLLSEAHAATFEESLGLYLAACDRELRRLYQREEENVD